MGDGLQIAQRLLDALRLKREPFQWMVFNSRANGDAVLVVAATYGVWVAVIFAADSRLSFFSVTASTVNIVFSVLVNGAFAWIIATGAAWALGTYVLDGSGRYGTTLPITGFAQAPLAAAPLISVIGNVDVRLAALAMLVWVFAVLVVGLQVALELPQDKALAAAGAWVVVWWIFFFIF